MMLDYASSIGGAPPHARADDRAVERWLRVFLKPYAGFCAMLAVAGEEEHDDARVEFFIAVAQTACRHGYSLALAQRIALGEWAAALAAARAAVDAVVRAVRPRIWRTEPGEEVLKAAMAADTNAILPRELLLDVCSKVAQARGRRRVRNR
jgi:hypothetical protein